MRIPERLPEGEHVVVWGGASIVKAVEHGHPEVARWLYMNAPHELNDRELACAIQASLNKGHIGFANFLLPPGQRFANYVDFMSSAADAAHRPQMIEMALDAGLLREDECKAAKAIRRLGTPGVWISCSGSCCCTPLFDHRDHAFVAGQELGALPQLLLVKLGISM